MTESWQNDSTNILSASSLVIGDLTGPDDNGWKLYYHTGKNYVARLNSYEIELKNYEEREANYSVIQAYESFTTYFKDMLAVYFYLSKVNTDLLKSISINASSQEYKNAIRENNFGRANKELFKEARNISDNFKNGEVINGSGLNLFDWYQSLSVVRDAIVHSQGMVKLKYFEKLTDNQKKILHRYFCDKNCADDLINVNLKVDSANMILERLAEFAFFIFKSLSIEVGKEWRVMKGQ
ncbi:hypothetical protein H8B13_00435 [Hymenobacter sp. BT188]|uniref:hypothetical protein n=1 Tax=Hymenobacter sp. BT188 TaxID=2763504 RepID=UPI0016515281|nr:hypothetical protein [Hymenobacter sp. BT188]MBC6605275.1 hypothetical protein [Hymenobacter sp. BT188]